MALRALKRQRGALWFLGALLVGAALLQTPVFARLRHAAWDLWISRVASFFSVGMLSVSPDIQEQLETLRAENIRLTAELSDYRHVRHQLGSQAFEDYRVIAAEIVGRPLDTFHAHLMLNRGTSDGVTLGAPVVVYESVVIGFISDISEHTASVQLMVHPDVILAAEAVDSERPARGVIQGRFFTAVVLKTIPRDVPLHDGQAVVTQERDGVVPYGLLIGTISRIMYEEHEPYQSALLALPYRLDGLRAVRIIVPP